MSENHKPFLERLPKGVAILDTGCGSGRDNLAFKKLGYQVTVIEGGERLCKLAEEYMRQEVKDIRFQDLEFKK